MSLPLISLTDRTGVGPTAQEDALSDPAILTTIIEQSQSKEKPLADICEQIKRLCATVKCDPETLEYIATKVMRIPRDKPKETTWRQWILMWCKVIEDPIMYLHNLYESETTRRDPSGAVLWMYMSKALENNWNLERKSVDPVIIARKNVAIRTLINKAVNQMDILTIVYIDGSEIYLPKMALTNATLDIARRLALPLSKFKPEERLIAEHFATLLKRWSIQYPSDQTHKHEIIEYAAEAAGRRFSERLLTFIMEFTDKFDTELYRERVQMKPLEVAIKEKDGIKVMQWYLDNKVEYLGPQHDIWYHVYNIAYKNKKTNRGIVTMREQDQEKIIFMLKNNLVADFQRQALFDNFRVPEWFKLKLRNMGFGPPLG